MNRAGPHAEALATTVAALYAAGKLGPEDEALVTLAVHLAVNLDENAAGLRTLDMEKTAHQYRMVLADLRGDDDDDDEGDDEADALVTRFRLAALGDAASA